MQDGRYVTSIPAASFIPLALTRHTHRLQPELLGEHYLPTILSKKDIFLTAELNLLTTLFHCYCSLLKFTRDLFMVMDTFILTILF